MDSLERCLMVKQEVFVYKIPPRQSARGYRAADWNLSSPDWTGRLRIMEINKKVRLKLEDRNSGELFAACPVDSYPGPAVEAVTDSSRYFVIKIVDEGGRSAYIGMGFSDRADSFDMNVTLQDHFQGVRKEEKISQEVLEPGPQLDLAFKEGQTIKVNINIPKSDKTKTRSKSGGLGGGLLPPPPAGTIKPPPGAVATNSNTLIPGASNLTPLSSPVEQKPVIGSNVDLLGDLSGLDLNPRSAPAPAPVPASSDPWGDFTSAEADTKSSDFTEFLFSAMLLDGVDLAAKTSSFLRKDPNFACRASEEIFNQMVDEIVLGLCFDIHKTIRVGSYSVLQLPPEENPPMSGAGHVDVFGLAVTTITGLPSLKTVPQIECPNCSRTLAASRFAPHLEKCMGMGRNSSRVATRRLATTKDSYRDGGHEEEDDDDDEWVEPGKKDIRRKRDKNSPRRHKSLKYKELKGENSDGMVTPPQSYDQLSLEDRRKLLTNVCGVTMTNNKICLRPTRCGAHTDIQRREVRLKWLGGKQEIEDLDMDSDTDTLALRESLSQLSNASSPAESVVSTSSNPGLSCSSSRHPGRQRDRTKRGKKGRPGSKNGSSRGSTPPMEH